MAAGGGCPASEGRIGCPPSRWPGRSGLLADISPAPRRRPWPTPAEASSGCLRVHRPRTPGSLWEPRGRQWPGPWPGWRQRFLWPLRSPHPEAAVGGQGRGGSRWAAICSHPTTNGRLPTAVADPLRHHTPEIPALRPLYGIWKEQLPMGGRPKSCLSLEIAPDCAWAADARALPYVAHPPALPAPRPCRSTEMVPWTAWTAPS